MELITIQLYLNYIDTLSGLPGRMLDGIALLWLGTLFRSQRKNLVELIEITGRFAQQQLYICLQLVHW